MLIVVTGAYGFIGSNLIKELNKSGFTDIIAVDNLTNGLKARNLVDCEILEFVDKRDFIASIINGEYDDQLDYIFHQGACSDTTMQDGRYMMHNNYEYSLRLLDYAQKNEVPLTYASSAAVYGAKTEFVENRDSEDPLNVYGYSKFLFDNIVRRSLDIGLTAPVVGLRYFNVYGAREGHKGRMVSVVLHNFNQFKTAGKVKLFEGCNGYGNGEQARDFISVEDVVKVNMFFLQNYLHGEKEISGVFNCGTGMARTFNDLSLSVINSCRQHENLESLDLQTAIDSNLIEYIPFPHDLSGKYQCYTQANMTKLRDVGFDGDFLTLEEGVNSYINWLYSN